MSDNKFFTSLLAGGIAGLCVDVILFPIDTIKTRLQSEQGFRRSGGFRSVYKGLGPVLAGSAPTSALFFCTYETLKSQITLFYPEFKQSPYLHMFAASMAEIVACSVRVPVEIVKQRRQIGKYGSLSAVSILWQEYKNQGFCKGIYRGFFSTVLRDIPFSFIQFPLWEFFKFNWCHWTGCERLTSLYVAICGAWAGAIAAAITTPLDVAKTRIMLSERDYISLSNSPTKLDVRNVLVEVYRSQGIKGIFSGFTPRVLWITLGGAIFLGSYDLASSTLDQKTDR